MTGEEKIVRHGKISAVYPERHTVRVTFEDADEVVSAEMPYLTTSASKNNLYRLPDIEEEVVCIFEGNDAGEGDGFCIGSFVKCIWIRIWKMNNTQVSYCSN